MLNTNYSPSFTALKVKYSAQDSLERLPKSVLQKLYRLGEYLDDTTYVDMEVGQNLEPVIKGKCQRNGGIMPPFEIKEPEFNTSSFDVVASRVGSVPYGVAEGEKVTMKLWFPTPQVAIDLYGRLNRAYGDFEKGALLTKLIDNELAYPERKKAYHSVQKLDKNQLVDNIMSAFGVFG